MSTSIEDATPFLIPQQQGPPLPSGALPPGEGPEDPSVWLDDSRVPRKGSTAVKFADLKTAKEMLDYAAAAFHLSVSAGKARTGNARSLWARAAQGYAQAYYLIFPTYAIPFQSDSKLASFKRAIDAANNRADIAKAAGGGGGAAPTPSKPSEPSSLPATTTRSSEVVPPPKTGGGGHGKLWLAAGIAAALGVVILASRKRSKKRSSGHAAADSGVSEEEIAEMLEAVEQAKTRGEFS